MAGLDGLGGVDSALIVDASSESGTEQVTPDLKFDKEGTYPVCHAEGTFISVAGG